MGDRALPAELRFPVVILREAVLATVRVERMPSLDRTPRFAAGQDRPEAIDVLLDARAEEHEARKLDGVMIRFLRRDFTGASYGLALALADKRARHAPPDGRLIVATGELTVGGEGAVTPVEGFDEKAAAVVAAALEAAAPLIFACPRANLAAASPEVRRQLAAAEAAGRLQVRAVDHLHDLDDLWGVARAEPASRWRALLQRAPALVAVGVLLIVAAGVGWQQWREPAVRCELAVAALEPPEMRTDATLLKDASDACRRAVQLRPNDGKMYFLTGQIMALDPGNSGLAAKYWESSAARGDKDGLATWGRHVWLIKGRTAEAVGLLERAGKLGSPAALEDLAEIYAEGRDVPLDLGQAEALLARARKIRRIDG